MNKFSFNQEYFLNSVEEVIESDELYTIMNKRILFCKGINTSNDLFGPPDICYLVKESHNKGFLGFGSKKASRLGCYHYVYGLDTSNIAFISAYISKYISKTSQNTKDSVKIIQSIFCVFDYFLEKDLRILIRFPGGIKKVFFIDDQQAIEANTDDLRTVYLSSLIRCWSVNNSCNNSVFLEELNNVDTFNYLIDWITVFLKEAPDPRYPNFKMKLQRFLDLLFVFLKCTRRFNISISFFSKLTTIDLYQIKYVIRTLNYLSLYHESLKYIATYLITNPTSSILSLEVNILSILKKYDEALEIGKMNCSFNPDDPDSWLTLSEVYLRKNQFENCLKALNNIYILKDFSLEEFNKRVGDEISFKENPFPKNKLGNLQFKYIDLLINPKIIDLYFSSNQFYLCENSEVVHDTINKIMNCAFYKLDHYQRKLYFLLLDMIKEINFEAFIEIRKRLFYFSNNSNDNESERSVSTYKSEGIQDSNKTLHKITINPSLEIVIGNLIEDLKMFSIVIAQDEAYFNNLFMKEDLTITEVKFCIAIGILSERLKYFNTALKFYSKSLKYSFSKYVYIRKIKIFCKLSDYRNALINLVLLLNYYTADGFKIVNKTPLWLDKIILKVLSEWTQNELIETISDANKTIQEFIMYRVVEKYRAWIESGHEIHLLK